jgi:hypothetical protein
VLADDFAIMAGAPLDHRKHTPAGRAIRQGLLAAHGIAIAGNDVGLRS